jgi:hypothetical protein
METQLKLISSDEAQGVSHEQLFKDLNATGSFKKR